LFRKVNAVTWFLGILYPFETPVSVSTISCPSIIRGTCENKVTVEKDNKINISAFFIYCSE